MKLLRFKKTKTTILGILTDLCGGTYFTLENASKAIPAGKYNVELNYSPKFKTKLPLIWNDTVPASRGIRIHTGNTYLDSAGCILIGNNCDLTNRCISNCKPALEQLIEACSTELVIEEV